MFSDVTLKVLPAILVTSRLFGPSVNSTVPVGTTVKLTLPKPRFENSNGVGFVVTAIVHGVGVGLGVGLTCGDGDGEPEGLAVGVGLAPGDGVGSAPGDGVGVGEAVSAGDGLAVGDAVGEGVGLGVGFGLLLPLVVEPLSTGLRFPFTLTFGTSSR